MNKLLTAVLVVAGCAHAPALSDPIVKKTNPEPELQRLARELPGFAELVVGMPIDEAIPTAAGDYDPPAYLLVGEGADGTMVFWVFKEGSMWGGMTVLAFNDERNLAWAKRLTLTGEKQ